MTEAQPLSLLRCLAKGVPSDLNLDRSSVSELQLLDDYLLGVLLAVRGRMNQLSSIDRFPPEVLAVIFNFVRLPKWHEDTDRELPPDHRSLVAITHVCRRWRTAALDCSSLWTGIVAYSSSAQTFSERSHGAPVDMSVVVIRGKLPKMQQSLLVKLRPLIRSLRISLDTTRQLPIFRKALKSQELSGSLQALAITVRHRVINLTTGISLFRGQATALESLSISSIDPLIPTDLFPSLLHLHLSIRYWSDSLDPLSQLLRNTPALETFHLHSQGWLHWSHGFEKSPIALPRIRRFCMTTLLGGGDSVKALSHFVLPPGALVSVQESAHCYRTMAPGLFSPSAAAGEPLRSALTVDEDGTTGCTRIGDSTYVIRDSDVITPGLFQPPQYVTRGSPEAQRLCRNPFGTQESLLANVHLLRIQGSTIWDLPQRFGIDGIALWRVVGRMPFLTTLVLRDFKREMLRNLTHLLEHDGDIVLCPVLSSVVLSTLDLPRCHRRDESPTGYTRAETSTPVLEVLFRATARRAERGYPLKQLTYCSPHNEREYTLENVHGVEHVAVLRRDVWAEYSSAAMDQGVAAHWAAVRRSMPANSTSVSDGYPALWEGRLRGVALPSTTRHFRTHGHARSRV